jgi:hypothetical protein
MKIPVQAAGYSEKENKAAAAPQSRETDAVVSFAFFREPYRGAVFSTSFIKETCPRPPRTATTHNSHGPRTAQEPVRHCLRDEAKKMRPDARPQARKNRRRIRRNTLRIFPGRERHRWLQIIFRSRTVSVGQAPRRMLKKSASGVLASLRDSTYRSVRLASSLTAALLDRLFEHPALCAPIIPN